MPQQGLVSKGMVLRGDSGHHYTLTKKLGEGQFAEVWEGRQSGSGIDLRVRGGAVSYLVLRFSQQMLAPACAA
jgi:hypothetical protein